MPPLPEKSAYDILGVPRTASLEEIKKRYRELARKHHPDVNRDNPSSAHLFAEVTTAYKTLSDTDSRRLLDAEMSLREQRAAQAQKSRFTPPPAGQSSSGGGAPRPSTASGSHSQAQSESIRLTTQAQTAFARGRFVEARSFAEQALRIYRRNAPAYEVLGDVYRLQGKTDEAMNAYSMSLQINPRNPQLMQRLERLARAAGSAPTAQRVFYDNSPRQEPPGYESGRPRSGAPRPSASSSGRVSRLSEEKRPWGTLLVGFFGYVGVFMMILWAALYLPEINPARGEPLLAAISTWNAPLVTVMALCGLLLGFTMTVTQVIRRIDDELVFTGVRSGGTFMPLGLIIVLVSLLNFYVAALLHTAISLVQESLTASMLRVFGAVTVIVVLLAAVHKGEFLEVLLWGGNVVFLTFVVGWLLGDLFRPDGY